MKKSQEHELRKYVGDLSALVGIKDYVFNDGTARGVRAFDLRNGQGLEMTVLADRGLDIPYCTFKGVNFALLNKVGVRSPYLYQRDANPGFLRQFYGGLLTTGGITHAGSGCEDNGRQLGLHGPFDNTPADHVRAWTDAEGDDIVLRIEGDIRECEVFSDNMVMHRSLTLDTERNQLHIRDIVENQGFSTSPLMLVYHINFGYPLLAPGTKIYTNAGKIAPRTEFAAEEIQKYDIMEEPTAPDEQCYFHTDFDGDAFAMIHNEKLGMAAIVRYDKSVFPIMCEWKCMMPSEYAIALEPTTSNVYSRVEARESGTLTYLEPGKTREFNITIEFTDDAAVINAFKSKATRPV